MKWKGWSVEKKVVAGTFLFVFCSFALMGVVMERNVGFVPEGVERFDGDVAVQYTQTGEVSSGKIRAIVKGSIYETGSNMTVFGACLDGDSYLLPGANATFTAWYPNGTIMLGPNATMLSVLDGGNVSGRWRIHVTMGDTIGTYLTEMRCTLDGPGPNDEFALAFGEWQNPEWVARIRQTQDVVSNMTFLLNNISSDISDFRNDTNTNFSQVLAALDNLNVSVSGSTGISERSIDEVYRLAHAVNPSVWVIDDLNPTFSVDSGMNNWVAVDMVGKRSVHAVSSDGRALAWDGESWTYYNVSGVEFLGVSAVSASQVYGWYVGRNTSDNNCVISINGATPQLGPSALGDYCYDVKVFQQPNNPAGPFYVYLLDAGGNVWFSNDTGLLYSVVHSGFVTGSKARVSQIIANKDLGVTEGFRAAFVSDGGSFIYYDGSSYTEYVNATNEYQDVALLYDALAYYVGTDTVDGYNKVWKYENGTTTEVYKWSSSTSATPVGIAAASTRDVWVVTEDPAVYYHYDGEKWEFARFAFSSFVSVLVTFGNVSNITGLKDITLYDAKTAYAVGSDGLVMKLESNMDSRFDEVLDHVSSEISQLNVSLQVKLDAMNVTLGNILSNVTYTQLYMETTLTPLVNATYQNTLSILVALGILQGQVNQTLILQNTTLGIVNETAQDVDELVNRSRRIRAWVTQ